MRNRNDENNDFQSRESQHQGYNQDREDQSYNRRDMSSRDDQDLRRQGNYGETWSDRNQGRSQQGQQGSRGYEGQSSRGLYGNEDRGFQNRDYQDHGYQGGSQNRDYQERSYQGGSQNRDYQDRGFQDRGYQGGFQNRGYQGGFEGSLSRDMNGNFHSQGSYQGGGQSRSYQGGSQSRDYQGGFEGSLSRDMNGNLHSQGGSQGGWQDRSAQGGFQNRGYQSGGGQDYGMNQGYLSGQPGGHGWDHNIGPMGNMGQGGSLKGRGPKGYKRSDQRIEEDINDRLMHQRQIDASEVEIKVQNGEVTLTGTVENRNDKHMIENLVDAIGGVQEIHNQIRLTKAGQSKDQSSTSGKVGEEKGLNVRNGGQEKGAQARS